MGCLPFFKGKYRGNGYPLKIQHGTPKKALKGIGKCFSVWFHVESWESVHLEPQHVRRLTEDRFLFKEFLLVVWLGGKHYIHAADSSKIQDNSHPPLRVLHDIKDTNQITNVQMQKTQQT